MGDPSALAYLASPSVVAASAVAGYIAGASETPRELTYSLEIHEPTSDPAGGSAEIIDGFPREISGRVVYLPKDNLNTDGIYGGVYTYKDDMTPAEMAKVIFLNYDPNFPNIGRAGDIIVGGKNFGSGSSREQAATALIHAGVRMVIAESLSQTYQRNAFNNGFIALECPAFVKAVRDRLQPQKGQLTLTDDAGPARANFAAGVIEYAGGKYAFNTLSETIQKLIVAQGVEAVVRDRLKAEAPA
jgi:homoaconitate hydratase